MIQGIDFTKSKINKLRMYGGANGNKIGIYYNDDLYMLKFPPKYFWEMFIGDALLGNFDRHNGNWGFLVNDALGVAKLAPIFDCGSCLYPQLDENKMLYVLSNRKEIDERIFVFPNSAIREDGRKINYVKFLTKTKDKDCIKALKKVSSMLDVKKINLIIESTPYISNKYKIFLKTIIKERKAAIIDKALERDLSLKIKKKNREMSL